MGIFYYIYKRDFNKRYNINLYKKKVFIKYKILNKIILNKDIKFIIVF